MPFFSRAKHPHHLVFDINSHSVNGVVVEIFSSGSALPVIKKRMGASLRIASSGIRTVTKIRELIFDAIRCLEQIPEQIVLGLGPSIAEYTITTWDIALSSDGAYLTKKDVTHHFAAAVESHKEQRRRVIPHLLEIYANGYPVTFDTFRGERVKTLSFRVFILRFSEEVGEAFAEAEKSLGGLPMSFVAHPVVFAEELREVLNLSDAIGVDVGTLDTTVIAVKQGVLRGVVSFPFGVTHFDRSFREDAKEEAFNSRLYGEKVFRDAVKKWEDMFSEAYDALYILGSAPGTVVITGEGGHLARLRDFFLTGRALDQYSYVRSPAVRTADSSAFFWGRSLGGTLHGFQDARIAALIRYIHK